MRATKTLTGNAQNALPVKATTTLATKVLAVGATDILTTNTWTGKNQSTLLVKAINTVSAR